jgi:carboxypeptidase C (cathepsin A)
MSVRRRFLVFALAILVVRIASAQAALSASRAPVVAVTHHAARIDGAQLRYTATVAENFVNDSSGYPAATIVTIAYVRDDVADRSRRPVMFLLPGGPGGSSASLELAAFGPKRIAFDGEGQKLIVNEQSPLDAVDLVFVDPIGTGYADPLPGTDGRRFWARTGDALAIKAVIAGWLAANGRKQSPRYLLGHSYGTTRAAMIVKNYPELDLDGLLLISLVANAGGRDAAYATTVPTFAVAAWYHGRSPPNGRTVEQVYSDAVTWSMQEYLPALTRGSALTPDQRRLVSDRLAALTGLSSDVIEASDLRVSKQTFMTTLLKDQGLRTGLLNTRATGRLDAPPQPGPYGDPGMPAQVRQDVIDEYFGTELGFHPPTTYRSLNLDVNRLWNQEGGGDVGPVIAAAMASNPKMRLFWLAGYFDLTTPAYSAEYALKRAGTPTERMTSVYVAAGHTISRDVADLERLSQAIRTFTTRR